MFKNLNCDLLGIAGRQSEIIEVAMTYGFRGISVDIMDLVGRTQRTSFESASRFLTSSKLELGGFAVPIDVDLDDENFEAALAKLDEVAEIAGKVEARVGIVAIPRDTDRLPYPEYFEVVSKRLQQIGAVLEKHGVHLAAHMTAKDDAEEKQFKFIQDVEGFLALVKTCPGVGVIFDSWTWYCGGGTPEQFDSIAPLVHALVLSDCVEGVSPESATANDRLLPASTGVIDNVGYLKKLVAAERSLPVSATGRSLDSGGTRDGFIRKVQDALDSCLSESGVDTETRRPEMFVNERSFASNAD